MAETSSFSRAANQCHVTQASLSNAVALTEELLGGRIFSRTTRKVEITSFGQHVLPMISEILNATDDLKKAAKEYSNPAYEVIRLGLTSLIDTHVVASILDPFRRRNPNIDVVFKECHLNDMEQRLFNGTVDFAFAPSGVLNKRTARMPFHSEPLLYLAVNSSTTSASTAGPVQLEEIARETFALSAGCGLADWTRKIFRKHRLKLKEYPGQALSYKVLADWADLGVAAAILPKSKVSTMNQTARPLHDLKGPVCIRYEMAWNRRPEYRSKHMKNLLAHFDIAAKKIAGGLVR